MLKKIPNKIKSPKNAQQNANFQIRKHKTERKPLHYNNTKKSRNTLPKIQNKSQNSIVVYQKGKNSSQKKRKSTEIGNKAINDTSKVHKNKIQKLNSFQSRRTKIVLSKSKAKDNLNKEKIKVSRIKINTDKESDNSKPKFKKIEILKFNSNNKWRGERQHFSKNILTEDDYIEEKKLYIKDLIMEKNNNTISSKNKSTNVNTKNNDNTNIINTINYNTISLDTNNEGNLIIETNDSHINNMNIDENYINSVGKKNFDNKERNNTVGNRQEYRYNPKYKINSYDRRKNYVVPAVKVRKPKKNIREINTIDNTLSKEAEEMSDQMKIILCSKLIENKQKEYLYEYNKYLNDYNYKLLENNKKKLRFFDEEDIEFDNMMQDNVDMEDKIEEVHENEEIEEKMTKNDKEEKIDEFHAKNINNNNILNNEINDNNKDNIIDNNEIPLDSNVNNQMENNQMENNEENNEENNNLSNNNIFAFSQRKPKIDTLEYMFKISNNLDHNKILNYIDNIKESHEEEVESEQNEESSYAYDNKNKRNKEEIYEYMKNNRKKIKDKEIKLKEEKGNSDMKKFLGIVQLEESIKNNLSEKATLETIKSKKAAIKPPNIEENYNSEENDEKNQNLDLTDKSSVSSSMDQQNFFLNCYEAQKIYTTINYNDSILKNLEDINYINNPNENYEISPSYDKINLSSNNRNNRQKLIKNNSPKKKVNDSKKNSSNSIDYYEIKKVIDRLNNFIEQYKSVKDTKLNEIEEKINNNLNKGTDNKTIKIDSEINNIDSLDEEPKIECRESDKNFNFTEEELENYYQIFTSIFSYLQLIIKRNTLNHIITYGEKRYRFQIGFEQLIILCKHQTFNFLRLLQQREYYELILKKFYLPYLLRAYNSIKLFSYQSIKNKSKNVLIREKKIIIEEEKESKSSESSIAKNKIVKVQSKAIKGKNILTKGKYNNYIKRKDLEEFENEGAAMGEQEIYNFVDEENNENEEEDESLVDDIKILDMVFDNLFCIFQKASRRYVFNKIFQFSQEKKNLEKKNHELNLNPQKEINFELNYNDNKENSNNNINEESNKEGDLMDNVEELNQNYQSFSDKKNNSSEKKINNENELINLNLKCDSDKEADLEDNIEMMDNSIDDKNDEQMKYDVKNVNEGKMNPIDYNFNIKNDYNLNNKRYETESEIIEEFHFKIEKDDDKLKQTNIMNKVNDEASKKLTNEISDFIINDIISSEIKNEKNIIKKKKEISPTPNISSSHISKLSSSERLSKNKNLSLGASNAEQVKQVYSVNSKNVLNNRYKNYFDIAPPFIKDQVQTTNSVFMQTVSEKKKEEQIDFYNQKILPKFLDIMKNEIISIYLQLIENLKIPLKVDEKNLMVDLSNQITFKKIYDKKSKFDINIKYLNDYINKSKFLDEKILNNFNKENNFDESIQNLNRCIFDTINELIKKKRIYGQMGEPVTWSVRTKNIEYKFNEDDFSKKNFVENIIKEINELAKDKIGLISENFKNLNKVKKNKDNQNKMNQDIKKELKHDEKWNDFEEEETIVKLMVTKIIMNQLLNEVVEILEHVQFSRNHPEKYNFKSIFCCDDIPLLDFQNEIAKKRKNLNSNPKIKENLEDDQINQ